MKRNLQYLEAVLLSLISAWSAVGCMITALRVDAVLDTRMGLIWCAVCLVSMGLLALRQGKLLGLLTLAGLAGVWYFLPLWQQLCNVAGTIAEIYDHAYGWGIPVFLHDAKGSGWLPMTILGSLIVESVVSAVFRRRGTIPAALLLVLPLAACLVVTNTVPEDICLFALLACLILLLLSQNVRAEGGYQGSRLTLVSALPVALALGLVFYLAPRDSYVNRTEPVRQQLVRYGQELAERISSSPPGLPSGSGRRDRVDLASLPSQPRLGLPVAQVAAESTGTIYLRLRDYDEYTGTGWVSSSNRQETLSGTGESLGAVVIRELTGQAGLLLPSFPSENTVLADGIAVNEDAQKVYRFQRMSAAMTATPAGSCLTLPEGTSTRARALVQGFAGDVSGVEDTAAAIADYVRSCAQYNRTIQPMPENAGDFALWFLEDAEQGYCVHFATAAVVLLRSAGIPARYVTGYKAEAVAGQTVAVTSDEAHAWAEYYNYKTWSWTILEATPGGLELTPVESTPAAEPETIPAVTTAPVQTTAQPETTAPQPQPEADKPASPWLLPVPLGLLLLGCGAEGQRVVRIRLRQRRQRTGPRNRRAIARWDEAKRLHRLLGRPVPEELAELAEKAMFSQHTLTKEELTIFTEAARKCRTELNTKPWYARLLHRYWYAVK